MSDVSVYFFMRRNGPGDQEVLSKRRATLEAIKDRGEPVMQSLRVVDHTEVDRNGFLIGGACTEAHPELWPEIRSLESRAKARDDEALKIAADGDSERRRTLQLESLELRNQARVLKARVNGTRADRLRGDELAQGPVSYWPPRSQFD
jgi:hypothetical protein